MQLIRDLPADKLTPARLWTRLDPETRRLAARALFDPGWNDDRGRVEADHAIASALRYRETAVRRLPVEKRIDYLSRVARPDDSLATSLLTALHLTHRRSMLAAFMDALGIPQSDGVIEPDHEVALTESSGLASAVESLCEGFPESEVEVYLTSLVALDPDVWGALDPLLRERAG